MSPCLSCATLAPCPCPAFLAWAAPPECITCLDASWLAESRETFENAATRLGMAERSLYRHLRGHGRDDIREAFAARRAVA